MNISVIGAGAWGIALAVLLNDNGHSVTLITDSAASASEINTLHISPKLQGVIIPDEIKAVCGAQPDISESDIILIATPSYAVQSASASVAGKIKDSAIIVCASKGIEASTHKLFSQIIQDELRGDNPIVALSGPTHAEEVSRKMPSACVVASSRADAALTVQAAFMNKYFRVYTSEDVIGVQLCGALKNIIALCAGICDGVGCGDNTIAALNTRGLAEIASLVEIQGGKRETVYGLAGVGDLFVTSSSRHSRNRRAGVLLGQGFSVDEAMEKVGAVV